MRQLFVLMLFACILPIQSTSQSEPVPFLADIVSQFPNVRDIAISPEGHEVIFSAQSVMGDISALLGVIKTKGGWSKPQVMSFSGQFFDLEPSFSPDGLQLYFVSNRPLDTDATEVKDFDIWVVERQSTNDKWSQPKNLGVPINTEMDEFYPSITSSGNLYFTLDNKSLKQLDDIYVSEFKNGMYTDPKQLGVGVNTNSYEFNAFVSPDESYLIFSGYNREDGLGSGDLYISHNDNGQWTAAQNLKAINSNKMDYCPYVDTETNTLYFTSKRLGDFVDVTKKKSLDEIQGLFTKYNNGQSRLYKVNFNPKKE